MQEREQLLNSERSARTEAERANRLRDEFVATLSHELRTPLTAILGWSQILTRNTTDPALMNKGLAVIERNVQSQSRLISDLMDVSRIIAGKLRLELQPLDITSVVEAAIETQSGAAEAKSIHLRKSLDNRIGRMIGDPARLQQVVWNLVSNAIKFTPVGGHIEISLRPTDGDAEIVVADSGIGIKPEFASHVFQRFAQADGTISRQFGGLGLGLSIVKELVQLHGGTVSARSAGVGKGATFTVRLPILTADTSTGPAQPADEATSAAEQDTLRLNGLRILIVEDESDAREFVQRVLEERGALVRAAATGAEALEIFPADRPDVLVSDIGLPEMDGYELIRRIRTRRSAEGGTVPAIALTAFAGAEDKTRALRAGYQAHVAKPIEPSELVAVVASFGGLVAHAPEADHRGPPQHNPG
jgi:CheY-like chemotaxis protein/nitrogen-specific signal transduction histidine kinase